MSTQNMFLWKNKKNVMRLTQLISYLALWTMDDAVLCVGHGSMIDSFIITCLTVLSYHCRRGRYISARDNKFLLIYIYIQQGLHVFWDSEICLLFLQQNKGHVLMQKWSSIISMIIIASGARAVRYRMTDTLKRIKVLLKHLCLAFHLRDIGKQCRLRSDVA